MIRLALIGGHGKWGRNYARTLALMEGVFVDVVDSRNEPPMAEWVCCDAIAIATHPPDSTRLAIEALEAGLHVMIEKPAALSVADAERLVEAERRSGKIVLVNHQHLFAPGYEELRARLLADDAHASTHIVHSQAGGPGPVRAYSALWDYGPHDVSMALDIIGPAKLETVKWYGLEGCGDIVFVGERGWADLTVSNKFVEKQRWFAVDHLNYYDYKHPLTRGSFDHEVCLPVPNLGELPLTRSLRAFAAAVAAGGTDDRRFGARWALDVARVLAAAESFASTPPIV